MVEFSCGMLARLQQCATKRKMSFCPQGWLLFSLSLLNCRGLGGGTISLASNKDQPGVAWPPLVGWLVGFTGIESHSG